MWRKRLTPAFTLHTRAHHEMDNNYHNLIFYPVLSRLYQHGRLCLWGFGTATPARPDTFSSDDDGSTQL